MQPDDPRVRRTRALRLHVQDAREENSLRAEFLKPRNDDDHERRKLKARERQAANRDEQLSEIRELARALSLSVPEVDKGVPSMRSLLDDVDSIRPTPVASLRALWQYLSGLAHPSALRAIRASDVELIAPAGAGIQFARMTAREDMILLSLDVALGLAGDLLNLVATRARNPAVRWARGDITMPPGWKLRSR